MKKLLSKLLFGMLCIGIFCGGIFTSGNSEKDISESVDRTVEYVEVSEETEEPEKSEKVEFTILEEEEATVSEEAETEAEQPVIEEVAEVKVEVTEAKETVVKEIPEVNEPEYSYSSMNQTMYASSAVNVRNLPSTDGDRVGGLSKTQEVQVIGKCNETGWYKIEYDGEEAYVSDSYLVDEKPVQQEPVIRSNNSEGPMVWIPTKGGKKYHSNSGCSGMKGPQQVTVDRAYALGFTPCKKCY